MGRQALKYTQRLDYARLAEVLHERGLANLDSIRELLQLSADGGMAFCEALVTSNLVSDWDLSKVVCETFQLPFLPIDLVNPNPKALEEIDVEFFAKHQLVPIDTFGQVITVAMPGLVPAEVLAQASAITDCILLPLVGTVESNRRWVAEHMTPEVEAPVENEGGWGSMFDEADASVHATLDDSDEDGEMSLDLDDSHDGSLDLGEIEALPVDDLEFESGADGPTPLPPMPDFDADAREAG